jgi:hypothetical protein
VRRWMAIRIRASLGFMSSNRFAKRMARSRSDPLGRLAGAGSAWGLGPRCRSALARAWRRGCGWLGMAGWGEAGPRGWLRSPCSLLACSAESGTRK